MFLASLVGAAGLVLGIVLLRGLVSVTCCFRVCCVFDVLGVVYGGWFNC